ncbi:MAG: hypothetical protein CMB48_05895 [Euryarchaeota archaeon]|nr:hypothetical protein [Euryarchaeota archaeon]|tara:strand:- start:11613 stop:11930 length:318 start_codon:yes stop_codon:yes gene_type:complete
MPKISKAARGKHRWLGLVFSENFLEIERLKDEIDVLIENKSFKLYDFTIDGFKGSCIIKIKLEDYDFVRKKFNEHSGEIVSITSSGKIRLVRLRITDYFQRQIDD